MRLFLLLQKIDLKAGLVGFRLGEVRNNADLLGIRRHNMVELMLQHPCVLEQTSQLPTAMNWHHIIRKPNDMQRRRRHLFRKVILNHLRIRRNETREQHCELEWLLAQLLRDSTDKTRKRSAHGEAHHTHKRAVLLDGGADGGKTVDDGVVGLRVVAGVGPPGEHTLVHAQRVVDLVQGDVGLVRVEGDGGINVDDLVPKSFERRNELGRRAN